MTIKLQNKTIIILTSKKFSNALQNKSWNSILKRRTCLNIFSGLMTKSRDSASIYSYTRVSTYTTGGFRDSCEDNDCIGGSFIKCTRAVVYFYNKRTYTKNCTVTATLKLITIIELLSCLSLLLTRVCFIPL